MSRCMHACVHVHVLTKDHMIKTETRRSIQCGIIGILVGHQYIPGNLPDHETGSRCSNCLNHPYKDHKIAHTW